MELDNAVSATGLRKDYKPFGTFRVKAPQTPGTYSLSIASNSIVDTTFGDSTGSLLHVKRSISIVVPEPTIVTATAAPVSSQPIVPGDKVKFSINFQKTGDNGITFGGKVDLFLSDDQTLDGDDLLIDEDMLFKTTVPKNGTKTLSTNFTVPAGLTAGVKYLIAPFDLSTPGVDLAGPDVVISEPILVENSFGLIEGRDKPVTKLPIVDGDGNKGTITVAPGVSGTVTENDDGTQTINATIEGLGSFSIGVKSDKKANRVNVRDVTVTGGNLKKGGPQRCQHHRQPELRRWRR